ncbi:MAG: hypothetical protein HC831_14565 [Chloroflexia bacterium]|nr:hypothetical protein [Chloroflexia bacterium]
MMKESIIINPDTIKIRGVKSSLDTIRFVLTDSLRLNEVGDSVNVMANLAKLPGIELTPQMVNCIIPVEKFTELNFNLPIKSVNVPKGYSVKLFPSTAKITCNVGFSKYQSVYREQFSLIADMTGFEKNAGSRLRIRLSSKPEYISNIRIHPQSIDYIIEKND